ncbi:Hypothetical protein IALB_1814 [Ignavibacterium album JCM 16511]|uniref:HEAT repeat protein n=1 Tax=Ignavibacterium album (strain DSM 19864 / JCM 16511 / NBRC 101810 / Mat9-16) TaxID=945713 RepID=I0AKL4_IGNAJ|nr:hypothetical protein [Ignavibacterium album]AFH49521.1 Hypothetical protein IALB_1814 [Ignavibacterium album JCM 16511]
MKNVLLIIVIIISVVFSSSSFATNSPVKKSNVNREVIIKNLMAGIRSDNYGLKTSSAFLLGEFKADEAVIELLSMLHKVCRC